MSYTTNRQESTIITFIQFNKQSELHINISFMPATPKKICFIVMECYYYW